MTHERDIEQLLDTGSATARPRHPIASSMRSRIGSAVSRSGPRGASTGGTPT